MKDDNIKWVYECEVCHNIFKSGTDEDYQIFKLHMKRYHKIDYRAEYEKLEEEWKNKYLKIVSAFGMTCPDCLIKFKNTEYNEYWNHVKKEHGVSLK